MRIIKFYVCPECGNVLTGTGEAEIICCGRKCAALNARPTDDAHRPTIETVEDDYFITFPHEMSKAHYISFAAWLSWDRLLLMKLYPEQEAEVRFPKRQRGKLLFCCSRHGLWKTPLS